VNRDHEVLNPHVINQSITQVLVYAVSLIYELSFLWWSVLVPDASIFMCLANERTVC